VGPITAAMHSSREPQRRYSFVFRPGMTTRHKPVHKSSDSSARDEIGTDIKQGSPILDESRDGSSAGDRTAADVVDRVIDVESFREDDDDCERKQCHCKDEKAEHEKHFGESDKQLRSERHKGLWRNSREQGEEDRHARPNDGGKITNSAGLDLAVYCGHRGRPILITRTRPLHQQVADGDAL